MLLGALDLMEGSLLILPGSALVALGTFLGQSGRRLIAYRVGVFLLIAFGVGAMWALPRIGNFGGHSGLSTWWGLLVLPYLIGWSMGIWGPRSPRWVLALGIIVGLFYEGMVWMLVTAPAPRPITLGPGTFVIGLLGVLTIGGCISRWRHRTAEQW